VGIDDRGETSGLRRGGDGPLLPIICSAHTHGAARPGTAEFTCCDRLSRPNCQERDLQHV
jgi:hypothetical protein